MKKLILIIIFLVAAGISHGTEEFSYDSKGKRDPFMPLVTSQGYIVNIEDELLVADMNLEGIIYDAGGRSMAVINGKVVKSGDNIGRYTIKEIRKERVILVKDEEESILELLRED
ncbi:MAG: hypothetical protein ACOY3D_07450 [Candidatus Omnitrophota bacterium]